MDFFSDRELGKVPATDNNISVSVWNGITAIIESFIADNSFSRDFPEQCPDGAGIYGCNLTLMNDRIKSLIPNLEVPIRRMEVISRSIGWEEEMGSSEPSIDTYSTLDLIEFCFEHIYEAKSVGDFHDFFRHHHYTFTNSGERKSRFRSEINVLFERNGIAFHLDSSGKIRRVIPLEMGKALSRGFLTKDSTLNQLLTEASQNILLPKISDRQRALEKLWDAFERAKSYYGHQKKSSATQLIGMVSAGNVQFESALQQEMKALTEIGNTFQIRHFETDKQPITEIRFIDYFFFRMFTLIDLFIKELEK